MGAVVYLNLESRYQDAALLRRLAPLAAIKSYVSLGFFNGAGWADPHGRIEGRISIANGIPDSWSKAAAGWEEVGASHLSVNTLRAGLEGPAPHIDAIRRSKEEVSG